MFLCVCVWGREGEGYSPFALPAVLDPWTKSLLRVCNVTYHEKMFFGVRKLRRNGTMTSSLANDFVARPGSFGGICAGVDSHVKRTEVFVRNLEKSP